MGPNIAVSFCTSKSALRCQAREVQTCLQDTQVINGWNQHACTQLLCDVLLCPPCDESRKMCFVTVKTCLNKPICLSLTNLCLQLSNRILRSWDLAHAHSQTMPGNGLGKVNSAQAKRMTILCLHLTSILPKLALQTIKVQCSKPFSGAVQLITIVKALKCHLVIYHPHNC